MNFHSSFLFYIIYGTHVQILKFYKELDSNAMIKLREKAQEEDIARRYYKSHGVDFHKEQSDTESLFDKVFPKRKRLQK